MSAILSLVGHIQLTKTPPQEQVANSGELCISFSIAARPSGADPGISERGGGGLYAIVVTFNANGVEGELRPRASGTSS